ncbi:unnamed protein product [Lactuca virosa]|uniref:Uncharacterized protein n=1 Tax=Lactuca virosa TaxID=75947 RepID=A0AAU9MSV0_9ASTR|nr:unnamed protein product [Lactuca virosa]
MYPLPVKHRYTVEQVYLPTKQITRELHVVKIPKCLRGVFPGVEGVVCAVIGSSRCMGVVCLTGDVRCDLGDVSPKVVAWRFTVATRRLRLVESDRSFGYDGEEGYVKK